MQSSRRAQAAATALAVLCAFCVCGAPEAHAGPGAGKATWTKLVDGPDISDPSGRRGPAMAYDSGHGVVVLFGGWVGDSPVGDTWLLEGTVWRRVATEGASPPPRGFAAMAYDSDRGKVYLFGGSIEGGLGDDTWEWDTASESWTDRTPTVRPLPRSYLPMAYDSVHERTVIFGGWTGTGLDSYDDTWVWDGDAGTWTVRSPANAPSPRHGHGMAYDSAHSVTVLFGGDDTGSSFGDTWVWDGDTWAEVSAPGPSARTWTAMSYDEADGGVLLFGGTSDLGGNGIIYSDTWRWDGKTNTWEELLPPVAPPGMTNPRLAYAGNGLTVLIGDDSPLHGASLGTYVWDGGAWAKASCSVNGPPAFGGQAVLDPIREIVVLFGGMNACGELSGQTWEWDGIGWRNVSPPAGPRPRGGHAVAFDPINEGVLLFGGSSANDLLYGDLSDTWLWKDGAWTEQTQASAMTSRTGHAMAASPDGFVTLAGGFTGVNALLIDTWRWDGTDWTEVMTSGAPSSREGHSLVNDASHGGLVLFGGVNLFTTTSLTYFGDTWVWDGMDWTQLATGSVPGRAQLGLAFDPGRSVSVLFGGQGGAGLLPGTYELSGDSWVAASPGSSPPLVAGPAMATAPWGEGVLLFGGVGDGTAYGDTWLYAAADVGDLGAPCGAPEDCSSGFCTDGFCCDVAACPACRSCDGSGSCEEIVPDGVACEDGDSCTVDDVCNSGACERGTDTCGAPGCECRVSVPARAESTPHPAWLLLLLATLGLATRIHRRSR